MVVEFLTQLHEVLKSYFGNVITEAILQEHHLTLYQLLDEMLDSGIPVNTHPGGIARVSAAAKFGESIAQCGFRHGIRSVGKRPRSDEIVAVAMESVEY